MDAQKQIVERLKQANNVLVTVTNNPSIDDLAALLGFGLALTKLDKHATAVYSGETPSTIEFLQPEFTIEKSTDSLRDFIISLDKSKADKLRYKVEDSVVRIFITPYRTSISDADLEYSQGDFNIDAVVALGVHEQKDLDQAITIHGRIFHDATVITINNNQATDLGSINWLNESASSISEMITTVIMLLGNDILDDQIATALLTGIVSETQRFSNEKTTANTMKASAVLMSAGANQTLVSTELSKPDPKSEMTLGEEALESIGLDNLDSATQNKPAPKSSTNDGTLTIHHDDEPTPKTNSQKNYKSADIEKTEPVIPKEKSPEENKSKQKSKDAFIPKDDARANVDDEDTLPKIGKATATGESAEKEFPQGKTYEHKTIKNTPTFPVYDTNVDTGAEDEFVDPMSLPEVFDDSVPVLDHGPSEIKEEEPILPPLPEPKPIQPKPNETLADIEKEVNSPHVSKYEELDVTTLKHPDGTVGPAVTLADDNSQPIIHTSPSPADQPPLPPIVALNAQPLGDRLHDDDVKFNPNSISSDPNIPNQPQDQPQIVLPPAPTVTEVPVAPLQPYPQPTNQSQDNQSPFAPPPVPPPIMPPFTQ